MKCLTCPVLIGILICLFTENSLAADRYWIATTSSNWNNTANWSATSGGAGGASVPGAADVVIYDGAASGNGNCNLDLAPTVAGITMNGYTGTIDLNGNNLTVTATTSLTFTSGTVGNSGAAATLSMTSTGTTTFNGSTFTANVNCVSARLLLNGSVFSGTTHLEKNGAVNDFGNGGNTFNGTTTLVNSGSGTYESGNSTADTFNGDLTITNSGTSRVLLADASAGNAFNGNVVVNSTAGSGVSFASNSGASAILASGKTITAGTFSTGALDLVRFTQTGGTSQSITLTGTSILNLGPGSTFNGSVTFSSPQVYLNGCTYNLAASISKTGATHNLGSGGNVFNDLTTLTNSGSGFFATAYTSPDIFNADLTVTNTGTAWIALADNTAGNQFNGNMIVNSTNGGTGSGITIGYGPGGSISAVLASGKTISVGGSGFSGGMLVIRHFTQTGSTAQSMVFTGNSRLYMGPYSVLNGNVDFRCPQIYLEGCTYNGTAYLEKKGGTNNFGAGRNVFNGATTFVNSGTALFVTAATVADTFNMDLTVINTGTSSVGLADIAPGTRFNGNVIVNSTAGNGITIAYNTAATASLAEGKTISVGGTGFSAGSLEIRHFTQGTTVGGTTQTLTFTGTATLKLGPTCVFNGNVAFTAPQVQLNGSTYNGTATITNNGTASALCSGANIFNGTTSLTHSGSSEWRLANTTGDTYNAAVTFARTSSGTFTPAYNSTSYFSGDVTISSSAAITFGAGTGVIQFEGGGGQSITSASSVPVIQRLVMNKGGTLALNTPVSIGATGTFTSGIINSTGTNYVHFLAGSTVSGSSNSSHVDGPVRKTGNTAFTFPVGNAGVYRAISIDAPGVVTDQFTAQYFKTEQPYGGSPTYDPSFTNLSSCEYWTMDRTNGTSNVNVTLSWNSADCAAPYITDLPTLRVARWNGSSWADHGNGGTTGNASAGTIITSAQVTSFSPFTLASISGSNPLPVGLVSFDAAVNGTQVDITWSTESENGSDYFTVERSRNNIDFEEIGIVQGAGVSTELNEYIISDPSPWKGISYYRLKQTDYNGNMAYLKTDVVEVHTSIAIPFSVYPNPMLKSDLTLYLKDVPVQEIRVSIIDTKGQMVHSEMILQETPGDFSGTIHPGVLKEGIYTIIVVLNNETREQKLIVLPID